MGKKSTEPQDALEKEPAVEPVLPTPEPESPKPEPEPVPLTGAARFRAEFLNVGSLRPLKWAAPTGTVFRIVSTFGFLCYADGSEVKLDTAQEASEIASLLQPIRPNDHIQIHTS